MPGNQRIRRFGITDWAWMANLHRSRQRLGRASAQARARSRTMFRKRRKKTMSGQGVTTQYDRRQIYRKRSMPRFKKRRWRRFVQKVNAVSERTLGTRSVVFNTNDQAYNANSNQQVVFEFALYGLSSGQYPLTDISNISALENTGNPTSAAGITVNDTTKFMFQSGVLDVTIRNASTVNVDGTEVIAIGAKIELDIYEISSPIDWSDAITNYGTLGSLFALAATETPTIANAPVGGDVTIMKRGVTPWDLPYALSKFRLKIWKKTKFFIPSGDTITYQIRDPKRHVWTRGFIEQEGGANLPGATRWLFCIAKLVPGLPIGTGVDEYVPRLDYGVTRKYTYKLEGANDDRDAYFSQP